MGTREFFQEYPEAEVILPIYSREKVMEWTGERRNDFPSLSDFDTFPTAVREYSAWNIEHLLSPTSERDQMKRAISDIYTRAFRARIEGLLSSSEPKSPDERVRDLMDIRNEFFAYPVQLERDFLGAFGRKRIEDWADIGEESLKQEYPFRNYYMEAIEYSQDAVPSFDQKKHLSPHFSGFVRRVQIMPEKTTGMYLVPTFTANGAYIQNGKIIWSLHDKERANAPGHWKESIVRWYSGDFILEEEYTDDWGRPKEQEAPKPASQKREAVFKFSDLMIKEIRVTQRLDGDKKEEFFIDITKWDDTYQTVRLIHPTHSQTISQLKTNPSFLSDAENIKALMSE